ncbi:unnamed protein product [Urochloa humidicola]
MLPAVVSSYSPQYGWMNFTRDEAGTSSAAPPSRNVPASPLHAPSPMVISPPRSPAPAGTVAARRGAPPFYTDSMAAGRAAPIDPIAPPPLPPAPATTPRTISTGHRHVPNGIGGHPNGDASEGEA